jgi:glycine cleavage system H protein
MFLPSFVGPSSVVRRSCVRAWHVEDRSCDLALGATGSFPVWSRAVQVPDDISYSRDHEWAKTVAEGRVRIGITDYAQDALGDVVFVQLPQEGANLAAGDSLGEVESTKSVSEIYAPIAGVVVAINSSLAEAPEQLNEDPYGNGWICEIQPSSQEALAGLLDASEYRTLIEES